MHWQTYLQSLPATNQIDLVDAITLGCGRLAWADRLTRQDAPVVAVAEALAEAQAMLLYGTQLMNPLLRASAAPHAARPLPPIEGTWKGYLSGCSVYHGAELVMAVEAAIANGEAAGAAALADAPVDDIRQLMVASLTALAQVHKLLGEPTAAYPMALSGEF